MLLAEHGLNDSGVRNLRATSFTSAEELQIYEGSDPQQLERVNIPDITGA